MVELIVFQVVVRIQNEHQLFELDASIVSVRCSTTFILLKMVIYKLLR